MTKARKSLLARKSSVGGSKALPTAQSRLRHHSKQPKALIQGVGGLCTKPVVDTFPVLHAHRVVVVCLAGAAVDRS